MSKIQIQSLTIPNWQDSTTTQLRIFSNHGFTASSGEYIPQGSRDKGEAYKALTLTYDSANKILTIPQFQIDSTVDGIDFKLARYSAYFFNSSGSFVKLFDGFGSFVVPAVIISASGCAPTSGASYCATWSEIRIYNDGNGTFFQDGFYTKNEINRLLAALSFSTSSLTTSTIYGGTANDSSLTLEGSSNIAPDGASVQIPLPSTSSLLVGPSNQRFTINPYSQDCTAFDNSGGAPFLFDPTFSHTSASVFKSVGLGVRSHYGSTTGGEGRFWTPFWFLQGNPDEPIPLGTKGNPSGFEANIFTAQASSDMSEAAHAFGATIGVSGGAPAYGTAISILISGSPSNVRGHNLNIQNSVSGGAQYGFVADSTGSTQTPTAGFAITGNWLFGLDLTSSTITNGGIRLKNLNAITSRNFLNNSDISLIFLNASDKVELGSDLVVNTSNPFIQVGSTSTGWLFQKVDSDNRLRFFKQGVGEAFFIDPLLNVVSGTGALATAATNGFFYLSSMAGIPSGTPTSYSGRVPLTVDTVNSKLKGYFGGSWVDLTGSGGGGGGGTWGSITGTLSSQADLQSALNAKADSSTLNASNLTSGTIPSGRFPSTLPALSGVNLTTLNFSNLTSSTIERDRYGRYLLRDLAAQLGKIRSGTPAVASIVYIGDSLVVQEQYTQPLRQMLQAQYGDAGVGFVRFDSSGYPINTNVTTAGTWTERYQLSTAQGLHINDSTSSDTATPASKTLSLGGSTYTTGYVIHYIQKSGGGSFRYRVDSGSWTTVNTANATTALATVSASASYGGHTLTCEVTGAGSTGVTLIGAEVLNGSNGVRLHMIGNTGSRIDQWTAVNATTWQQGLAALNPNLVILEFSTNDQSNLASVASVQANFITLVNRVRTAVPTADIVLSSDVPTGNDGNPSFIDTNIYANAIHDTARSLGVAFVDFPKLWGSYNSANARGLMSDTAHPSAAGGRVLADFLYSYLNDAIGSPFFGATFANSVSMSYGTGSNGYRMMNSDNSAIVGMFGNSGNDIALKLDSTNGVGISFIDTNLQPFMRMIAGGSIGVGTSGPIGRFHVVPISSGSTGFTTQSSSGQSASTFLVLDASANFGITALENRFRIFNSASNFFSGETSSGTEYLQISPISNVYTIASLTNGGTRRDISLDAPNLLITGLLKVGSSPTTLTDSAGKILSASLNTVGISQGGTGQTSQSSAFNALSPMTTSGDIIYGGSSGTGTRLAKGSDGQVLTLASGLPSWASPGSSGPTINSTNNVIPQRSNSTTFVDSPITGSIPGSMVDGITITGAATANPAITSIASTGSDTNIGIKFLSKGNAPLSFDLSGGTYKLVVDSGSGSGNGNGSSWFDQVGGFVRQFWDRTGSQILIEGDGVICGKDSLIQFDSTTSISGAFDLGLKRNSAGVLEINNSSSGTYRDLKLRHLIGGSSSPTIAAGAGAGTSPTVSLAGSDLAGQITVTSGTLPSVSAVIVTVTFNASYGSAPYVILWPANANAATLGFLPYVGSTTSTFTVNAATIGLGAATQYVYNYMVVQ